MAQEKNIYTSLSHGKNSNYLLILQGILVGITAGLVVSLYRFLLSHAESFAHFFYGSAKSRPILILPIFLVLIFAGLLVGFLTNRQPLLKGSGIPQAEGRLLGFFHFSWWKIVLGKILGGVICIGAGLSLGREGPSIQIGSAVGEGVSKGLKRNEMETRHLLTCGASAGLAAAFNAPLAGVLFSLEEMHKNFSVGVLLSCLASSITADIVSKLFWGMGPVFGSHALTPLPLQYYYLLPFLGVLMGFAGWFFNKMTLLTQRGYQKVPFIKPPFVMIIPFLAAGIAGLFLPEIMGGGHGIISAFLEEKSAFSYALLLLVAKFSFTMICFGSGAPGGIFFPLLVLGTLLGGLFASPAIAFLGIEEQYYINFLLLGMVGMFTGVVRAPITGIILVVEMSGSFTQMLSLSLVAIFAHLTADFMGSKPIYESLLHNMKKSPPEPKTDAECVLLTFSVEAGSPADQRSIKELHCPGSCLPVTVLRGGDEIFPSSDLCLQTGDYISFLCPRKSEISCREELNGCFLK